MLFINDYFINTTSSLVHYGQESVLVLNFPLSTRYEIRPKTKPQNAPPTPNKLILAVVARKVMSEASRQSISLIAFARLPAIVPNNASPARVLIKATGNAAKTAANVTPKIPTRI